MLVAFTRGCQWVCGAMAAISMIIVALLALPVSYDAIMRTFGHPTIWVFEVSLYALIAGGFLANPLSMRSGAHFRVAILHKMFPSLQRFLNFFSMAMTLLFALLMIGTGTYFVHYMWSFGIRSDSLFAFPLWIPTLAIPVGGLGLFLQTLVMMLTGEVPGEESDVVVEEVLGDRQK